MFSITHRLLKNSKIYSEPGCFKISKVARMCLLDGLLLDAIDRLTQLKPSPCSARSATDHKGTKPNASYFISLMIKSD